MQFSLSKTGTIDEVRQALYEAERSANPESDEEKLAIRAFGHAIAVKLDQDPREIEYHEAKNAILAGAKDNPNVGKAAEKLSKPKVSVSANASITVNAVAE